MTGLRRTARIDVEAFAANVSSWIAEHGDCVLDARADAYGHGLTTLARVALDAGASAIRISPRQEPEVRRLRRSAIRTLPTSRPLLGAEAYGLAGRGTPVMTVIGEVVSVKHAAAGAGVSYGYSYHTNSDTILALVALGYADGIPRLASNQATVFVGGAQRPVVGRVAMDQFVAECGTSAPEVGSDAVMFGNGAEGHPLASALATLCGRSALELTAGIGRRVVRVTA